MSTSRTFVGAALAAGAIVVAVALWMRGGAEDEEPTEEMGTSAATPTEEPEPFEEPAPAQAAAKPAPAAPAFPLALPPPRKGKDGKPEPLEPQIREHAILMMTPLAKEAMEQGQLEQLKVIQKEAKDRPDEGLMKPNDVEALDIAIGCLEKAPDAHEDATDFIEFGTANSFGDSLKKVCFGGDEAK